MVFGKTKIHCRIIQRETIDRRKLVQYKLVTAKTHRRLFPTVFLKKIIETDKNILQIKIQSQTSIEN